MTGLALALVLVAAFLHATWNLVAKRAAGGLAFWWLVAFLGTLFYLPAVVVSILWAPPPFGPLQLLFVLGTGLLHGGYFLALGRGYRTGDLSVVYPLARGTGPLLSTLAAIALLGERPSLLALGGMAAIVLAVVLLTATPRTWRSSALQSGVTYALLTGVLIATYTLWDKYAVSRLAIPPLLLDWAGNATRTLVLAPLALSGAANLSQVWAATKREAAIVAVLAPLAYILVLTALRFTAVSYVAPAREVSILIGTVLGTRVLAEGDPGRKLAAAAMMVAGVVALALG